MKRYILIDSKIPYIKGVFEQFTDYFGKNSLSIRYVEPTEFCGVLSELKDCCSKEGDYKVCLIIRTRTICREELLKNSNVDIIATATIGIDHIDLEYCRNNNIKVFSAPGCNSGGVAQYLFTSLYFAKKENKSDLLRMLPENSKEIADNKLVLGVIGCGNVGSKVVKIAQMLGFKVLINDPPKERELLNEGLNVVGLKELLNKSDIITTHVPLDNTTKNFANREFFSNVKNGAVFINTSRGEVVNERDLLEAKNVSAFILDVWLNEPAISKELLNRAIVATPHIAGYSIEGKVNGTQMVIRAIAKELKIDELCCYKITDENLTPNILNLDKEISKQLLTLFPINELDEALRTYPDKFEQIRANYKLRREFILK